MDASNPVHVALTKIEMPSILFFLGILMAVAALESLGLLFGFAQDLNAAIPNSDIVVAIFGLFCYYRQCSIGRLQVWECSQSLLITLYGMQLRLLLELVVV
ncbi:MAG: hypothetical protein CM15mP83_5840 [Flavobacteriaceae bacterium]|nr:MAG: hypothetical protein CM15mP83_5840 [Flavobacteriaceae bacterium]